jgi:peptidoglycan lytic transglycosylase A
MPLPDARPSEKIAKLFPQGDSLKDPSKDPKNGAKPADTSAPPGENAAAKTTEAARNRAATPQPAAAVTQASPTQTAAAKTVPLPEARPNIEPLREKRRHRGYHRYRRGR